jgi:ATP-dependent Clp protease protease subunit
MPPRKLNKKSDLPISRIITLGEIDNENVNDVIEIIQEINHLDKDIKAESREPIKIYINSTGGFVYHGFGLVDCIYDSITPVHTISYGCTMSMALPILVAGHYRQAGKRATFMYHEVGYEMAYEKAIVHEAELKEGKRLMNMIDDIMLENTDIPKKKLDSIKKSNREWYFDAEEALALGVIDEII